MIQNLSKEVRLLNRAKLAASLPAVESRRILQEALDEYDGKQKPDHYPVMNRAFATWLRNTGELLPDQNKAEKSINCPGCGNPFVYRESDNPSDSLNCPQCAQKTPGVVAGAFSPESLTNRATGAPKGCLMAMFPDLTSVPEWAKANLNPDSLTADGIEFEPHVTVLYGWLPSVDLTKLSEYLRTVGPVPMKLGKLEKFENPENGYDVIKFAVESPALIELNKNLREKFAPDIAPSDFPEFHPHLTVAYVKPGTPVPEASLGTEMVSSSLQYSPAENKDTSGRTVMPLIEKLANRKSSARKKKQKEAATA